MRGLLIFYLTQHFLFDDKTARRASTAPTPRWSICCR
jgi:dipeptide/tripeptide permease